MKLVLKGSVVAVLASGVVTGCGSDKDDGDTGGEAGQPSTGGSNTAGTKSNEGGGGADAAGGGNEGGTPALGGSTAGGETAIGGEASGGAAQGGAAQGGASGMAVGKFCNGIVLTTDEDGAGGAPEVDNDTTFRVELGVGDDMVEFTATTGECAPADGEACTPIPVGNVPYKLFDADTETELDSGMVPMIADGEEWFFWSEIFEGFPVLSGDTAPSMVCADTTYDDLFPAE
jgi:hypothetical protein